MSSGTVQLQEDIARQLGDPPAKVLGIPASGTFQHSSCDQMLTGGAHGKCGSVTPVVMGVTGLQPGLLVVYTQLRSDIKSACSWLL